MAQIRPPDEGAHTGIAVLRVRPDTFEWGSADDDRWRADLADLEYQLRRELPDETAQPAAGSGTRGPAEISEVVLALGSAGAVTATVEIIKAWISAKPGRRKVRVVMDTGTPGHREVLVDADGLGAAEVADLAEQGIKASTTHDS
jgi:hypothetical protein